MHSFLVSSLGCENYPFGFIAIFYHFQNTIYFISIVNCDCVSVRILFFCYRYVVFIFLYIGIICSIMDFMVILSDS